MAVEGVVVDGYDPRVEVYLEGFNQFGGPGTVHSIYYWD